MASGRRYISLSELAHWRRSGLLPPFSSRGRGQGKGKTYYWTQTDILAQAQTVHDLLHRHGRADTVLVTLWLCGFDVPLSRLRRAWMSTRCIVETRKTIRGKSFPPRAHADDGVSGLLLDAMFNLADAANMGAAADDTTAVRLIAQALAKVDMTDLETHWNADAARLWRLLRMLAAEAHVDALVVAADEGEMRQARRYLSLATRLLQDATTSRLWIAERMARPLFSLAVAMLRSGRGDLLARLASRASTMGRQNTLQPVHAQVQA
jgi:hypothetical protein